MLNIPETVKALYKQDGVNKNFRAHFPNGELPDITNDNIVQESVKFQESVCSQDVFKFGLTEASVIEFETVGVANMYGMTIECSSEIDCSSLTAAEIAEIEAGTWDGEYVALADSDLGYAFYRVPYGTFRVESCPRNHEAMAHRKVTGYTAAKLGTSPPEEYKLSIGTKSAKSRYTPDANKLVLTEMGWSSPNLLENYQSTEVQWQTNPHRPTYETFTHVIRNEIPSCQITLEMNPIVFGDTIAADDIYRLEIEPIDPTDIIAEVTDFIENGTYSDALLPYAEQFISGIKKYFAAEYRLVSPIAGVSDKEVYQFNKSLPSLYPMWNSDMGLYIPHSISVRLQGRSPIFGDIWTKTFGTAYQDPHLYRYDTGLPPSRLLFEPTGEYKPSSGGVYHTFIDAYDLLEIAGGIAELQAGFASPRRLGGYELRRISNSSPVPVVPGEYSQMWFDEYDVEPIGTIRYAYTDEAGEEQIVNYQFGDGASVYDMTDNAVLKAMDGASPEVIEALLDSSFIPYLAPVNFTPIDLAMKGLPYIEAGDALTVTAQDGTVCNSYALRMEIDGIQALSAQIDSQSGLIIDSEEGT